MTLRKLGKSRMQEVTDDETFKDLQKKLIKQFEVMNDYLALMNNTEEPPERTDIYDAD